MEEELLRRRRLPMSKIIPSATTQVAYLATGAFAGLCTIPVEYALHFRPSASVSGAKTPISTNRLPAPGTFIRSQQLATLYRPAIRFWTFCLARSVLQDIWPARPGHTVPARDMSIFDDGVWQRHARTAVIGGLSGGVGGISELLLPSLLIQPLVNARNWALPDPSALLSQSSKLFLCFGTYTLLSSLHSGEHQPPKPFWKCWGLGAIAGAVGSAIVASAEDGVRKSKGGLGWQGLLATSGKGACVIGTVIGVQVSSCAWVLEQVEHQG